MFLTEYKMIFLLDVKLRLHYNEWAQCTPTVWRYFAFVDIRWYTLKLVCSSLHTLLFAQNVEIFCACTKISCTKFFRRMPTNGQYAEGSFTERNPNGMFVHSRATVRFLYGGIRPTKLWAHLNDLRTYK